jgi:hypothetical protein
MHSGLEIHTLIGSVFRYTCLTGAVISG